MQIARNRNQLEVLDRAIKARQRELETRRRLKRGFSVGDMVDELASLESMAHVLAGLLAFVPNSTDCTGGNGVSIGPKVAADPSLIP